MGGVVRAAERAESSAEVLAAWSLTFTATGPREGGMVSSDPAYFFYGTRGVPLEKVSLTFWVTGWFAAAL